MKTMSSRFWSKVDKSGTNKCWNWKAGKFPTGYGNFTVYKGWNLGAHRFSWMLTNGEIPSGLCVLHSCDNTVCVNPKHLWLGTHAQNIADKVAKKRQARGQHHGNSKLTNAEVRKIKRQLLNGITPRVIGRLFGVHRATIHKIKIGKNWGHVQAQA